MNAPLNVWLLNPYHTGSHQAWAEGYARTSRHRVRVLSMVGQFWKWRMQGGALELAQQARSLLALGQRPDVLVATGMVNLPAFLALVRRERSLAAVPVMLYMHENQLTYPLPPGTKRDLTYGMIQYLSMLSADIVCFNSRYHLESWFEELPRLLKHFPDYGHLEGIAQVRSRARVLPVGCDLHRFDRYPRPIPDQGLPLVLWNQRWEYDKDPETMLQALYILAQEGVPFRVALAGENFRNVPVEFNQARSKLGKRLVHYGYAAGEEAYVRLLLGAQVVLSTAVHEFFGTSIVEAVYCGCRPVLPNRLSYPELIPDCYHDVCLYEGFAGLLTLLRNALGREDPLPGLPEAMARFDWSNQAEDYDRLLEELAEG